MTEQTPQPTKRPFPMRWCALVLLVFVAFAIFVARNAIQIQYHKFVYSSAIGEFARALSGKPPTLVGRLIAPRQLDDIGEHSKAKLVELGALQHRLYLFPRIKPSTDANQWLSHEFRAMQKQLMQPMSSSSGGTRDKATGESVRSIEIWLDPSADVSQWDAWKASVDAMELDMMRLEEQK